jgi:hypothetical protein
MIFFIHEDDPKGRGRWVCNDDIDLAHESLEGLKFSDDGTELLALFKVGTGSHNAIIYNTATFPRGDLQPLAGILEKPLRAFKIPCGWPAGYSPIRSGISFSSNPAIIAICTTCKKSKAVIALLRKVGSQWKALSFREVGVFDPDNPQLWNGGITGISMYFHAVVSSKFSCKNDECDQNEDCLVLSIDSLFEKAQDCYRIAWMADGEGFRLQPLTRLASGKASDLAVTVSPAYSTVALLNKSGILLKVLLIS